MSSQNVTLTKALRIDEGTLVPSGRSRTVVVPETYLGQSIRKQLSLHNTSKKKVEMFADISNVIGVDGLRVP